MVVLSFAFLLMASFLPNDSEMIDVTSAFMLTPSYLARAASLACKLFGIRCTKRRWPDCYQVQGLRH
jgi:hypothetical protein